MCYFLLSTLFATENVKTGLAIEAVVRHIHSPFESFQPSTPKPISIILVLKYSLGFGSAFKRCFLIVEAPKDAGTSACVKNIPFGESPRPTARTTAGVRPGSCTTWVCWVMRPAWDLGATTWSIGTPSGPCLFPRWANLHHRHNKSHVP